MHREQDFANYLALHDYRNAILLALSMAQPGRLHALFSSLPTSADANTDDGYPSLAQLFNALAQRSLDTECDSFRRYLNIQLAYLYMDCPELASPGFLSTLPVDIRQYHLDRLSDTLRMQAPKTIEHERDIRERARKGDWVLMYQGSAEVGGLKIDREYEARLLAKLTLSAAAAAAARVAAGTQEDSVAD